MLEGLVDLLLPQRCRQCGIPSSAGGYCAGCAASLERHPHPCRICGTPFTGDTVCGGCQHNPPPFDETIAPFKYAPPVSEDVHKLKYHRNLACGRDLGCLLALELEHRDPFLPEVLVPVPLHWKRRFKRGFNQSVEIARPVSRQFGVPINVRLVRRVTHTVPQVGLKPAQRRDNLRRAFRVTGAEVPDSVAIVDDVVTSGATVSEVARCLREAGVRTICVWAVSHA